MSIGYTVVDLDVLPAYVASLAILLLAPGPDMAFVVATGLRFGRSGAVRAAFGIAAGVGVYVVVTALGLGMLLTSAPSVLGAIQLAGAAYLAHLAWTSWKSSGSSPTTTTASDTAFRRGFMVNIANPKIMLFFIAFLPQFLGDAEADPTLQLLVLGLILQAMGLLTDLAIGWAAGSARDRLLAHPKAPAFMQRVAGGVYGVLAALLIVDVVH